LWQVIAMHFPKRLVALRNTQGFTQQSLADAVGMHVNQIKKYEAGSAQPTLRAMVKLAQTLHVSLDELVFEEGERGPDEDLRLQFEAVSRMPLEEKKIVQALLDGLIVKHQTRQMASNLSG
jgi:transcriptional regulator with XRE-family HTH domain